MMTAPTSSISATTFTMTGMLCGSSSVAMLMGTGFRLRASAARKLSVGGQRLARGYWTRPSALNQPVGALLLMLGPALLLASNFDSAWPKFVGMLYGATILFAVLNSRARFTPDALCLALAGVALAVCAVGFV